MRFNSYILEHILDDENRTPKQIFGNKIDQFIVWGGA